jgi:hypothetical protein
MTTWTVFQPPHLQNILQMTRILSSNYTHIMLGIITTIRYVDEIRNP